MPDLLDLLRSGPASALDEAGLIWHLPRLPLLSRAEVGDSWRLLRRSVLTAMATSGLPVFLRPPDEPPDPELKSYLVMHPTGAWEVLDGRADSEAMHSQLDAGDWLLYTANEPVGGEIPDAFRTPAVDLAEFMRRRGVAHLVAAFHDDTEWMIGVLRKTT